MRVSELPISMAAQTEARLSAPVSERSAENAAVDAEPDTGRVTARGITSAGIPRAVSTGEVIRVISSAAPLFWNMVRAHTNAVSVGISEKVVRIPSRPPRRNASKGSSLFPFLLLAISAPANSRTAGKTSDDSISI